MLFKFLIFTVQFVASEEFKIILKINNSIITNKDIINEYNYLIFLNKDLNKIPKAEVLNIAKSLNKRKYKKMK